MKIERASRYKDKLSLISKRVEQIESWLSLDSPEEFLEDDKTRLASYKAFQETVEACLDIVAMMGKDSGILPKDDYSNLENLEELHEATKKVLIEANGLRNHLVHRYNKMDDLLALESMKALLSGIQAFCAEVEAWIEKMF
jgi:uncharacterized protein YutE (UPF0331/DUF86 family)